MKTLTLVVLCGLLVSGCGSSAEKPDEAPSAAATLFPDDFKGVCSGAGVAKAAQYQAGAAAHKALLFATYRDDLQDQSHRLPPAWTVTFSPDRDALAAIDVVICAKRTADKLVKTCDNYESKGKTTGNKVRWHTATYQVTVREARTGKELADQSIEANDETCPMFASFDSDNQTIDDYASLSDSALSDFVRPYVQQ